MKKIFLIDGDNNINLGLRGIEMLTEDNHVMIFHSKAMEITKFQKKLSGCRAKIDFVESVRSGKNSLDFQITTELGFLSHNKELECAYIISCDKGYDAAVDYVKNRYSGKFKELERKESIFDCFQLSFVLKTKNKQELNNALVKEYGVDHGNLVYNHLRTLFGDVSREAGEETRLTGKAEKKVAVVQQKVQEKVEQVVEAASSVREPRKEKKTAKVQKKKTASARESRTEKKVTIAEAMEQVEAAREEEAILAQYVEEMTEEPAAETRESDSMEMLKGYNIPLRFGAVRTEEQNQSFYKSKDLRKKNKPQVEVMDAEEAMARGPEEKQADEAHMEAVVEVINEARRSQEAVEEGRQVEYTKRPQKRDGNRRSDSGRRSQNGERRNRSVHGEKSGTVEGEKREGKVVPMKAMKEAKGEASKAETSVSVTAKTKAAGVKPVSEKSLTGKAESKTAAEVKSSVEKTAAKKAVATKPSAVTAAPASPAPTKKASGQSGPGFFGRMFGKKKN